MVELDDEAKADVFTLVTSYEAKGRPEATRNLRRAVAWAVERIEQRPEAGLTAPRPYPEVSRPGVRWLKEGHYWFAYSTAASGSVVLAVVYDQADIPRRL